MAQRVALLGTGRVAHKVLEQLSEERNPPTIVGIASNTAAFFRDQGISRGEAYDFIRGSPLGSAYRRPDQLVDLVREAPPVTFVDMTRSQDMLGLYRRIILDTNHHLVTANKLPLVEGDFKTFGDITYDPSRIAYRSAVMRVASAISTLHELRVTETQPVLIRASMSGTLSYALEELEKGVSVSESLTQAWKWGYTAEHPAIDLLGIDVAMKMVVLGRTAGFNIGMQNITIVPFIHRTYLPDPEHMPPSENVPDFLKNLSAADAEMQRWMASVQAEGETLRYVARLSRGVLPGIPMVSVQMQRVKPEDPLFEEHGTLNKIVIKGDVHDGSTETFTGHGAGLDAVASHILRDIRSQAESQRPSH